MNGINTDDVAHPLARYSNHLKFNGYHIEENENVLYCLHHKRPSFIVKYVPNLGIFISTFEDLKANIERIRFLEYVNDLNSSFLVMRAYIDHSHLKMATFLEDDYNMTRFSNLLDNIEYDMEVFMEHELTEEYCDLDAVR